MNGCVYRDLRLLSIRRRSKRIPPNGCHALQNGEQLIVQGHGTPLPVQVAWSGLFSSVELEMWRKLQCNLSVNQRHRGRSVQPRRSGVIDATSRGLHDHLGGHKRHDHAIVAVVVPEREGVLVCRGGNQLCVDHRKVIAPHVIHLSAAQRHVREFWVVRTLVQAQPVEEEAQELYVFETGCEVLHSSIIKKEHALVVDVVKIFPELGPRRLSLHVLHFS